MSRPDPLTSRIIASTNNIVTNGPKIGGMVRAAELRIAYLSGVAQAVSAITKQGVTIEALERSIYDAGSAFGLVSTRADDWSEPESSQPT